MLSAQHSENLLMMLRSLDMAPFSPSGLIGPGLPSSSGKIEPMTPEGAFDEAKEFPDIAYGATLGVVYYRYMDEALRQAWDVGMDRRIKQAQQAVGAGADAARSQWIAQMQSGKPPTPEIIRSQMQVAGEAQRSRRKLDFLISLQGKKQSVFAGTSNEIVNDAKTVGQNPWCQSDSEFEQTVLQEVGNPIPNPQPAPNYGFAGKPREATNAENINKTLNTMLTAKYTAYLDSFLELGEERIKGMLVSGISHLSMAVVRHIPIADLIVDWVKDKISERQGERLVEAYKIDRTRRLRLAQLGWGNYRDPDGARLPSASDFTKQVIPSSS